MSVRRLAKDQPASFAFSKETMDQAQWWIAKYPANRRQSAVIPILWLVQKQEGWVSEPAIRAIAELLTMPVIRVFEVATFYTMFQLEPVGTTALIQVCGTTPCRLRGANDLMKVLPGARSGPKRHTRSADGRFSWEEVECLGACVNAPMAQINDYYYEDLTPESLSQIIDDFAAGGSRKPGLYAGRHTSEPAGGALTLTDPALYDGSAAKPIKSLPNAPEPRRPDERRTRGVPRRAAPGGPALEPARHGHRRRRASSGCWSSPRSRTWREEHPCASLLGSLPVIMVGWVFLVIAFIKRRQWAKAHPLHRADPGRSSPLSDALRSIPCAGG